jgi:NADP-dependent 3-hydroxy acid dehydrogenase YdfG
VQDPILISPGVTTTELGSDIAADGAAGFLKELRKTSLTPDAIARAFAHAISQSAEVDVLWA